MRYTIISGTGRAGTSLLVRVFTRAGLDTGFSLDEILDPIAHAGLERDLGTRPGHRIVKSPWISRDVGRHLAAGIEIEHAIICVRHLEDAAASRQRVPAAHRWWDHPWWRSVNGGLWLTRKPREQEVVLTRLFYNLVFHLTRHGVPLTFLHFPRYVLDHDYATRTLSPVFPDVDPRLWGVALGELVRPELIHIRPDR